MVEALAFEIRRLGMGEVDSDFTMKNDYAHPTSQKRGDIAVTSHRHLELTNAEDRHPRTDFIIDVKVCASWLMQMGIGRPDGMLTRLCLRTIPLHRQRMKNSASMRAVMLLSVMPFSLLFWAVLVVLALRRRDFCALWLVWNFDSMMLSVNVRA